MEHEDEPQDDDYEMSPYGPLGGRIGVTCNSKCVGTYADEDAAYEGIRRHRAAKNPNGYPSVFWISDHGNVSVVSDWKW